MASNLNISNDEAIHEVAKVLKSCRQVDSPLGGECDTSGHPRWTSYSTHYYGTDEFMFSALPGGVRPFQGIGSIGYWWFSSEVLASTAWSRGMSYGSGHFLSYEATKEIWLSVRCVRDE